MKAIIQTITKAVLAMAVLMGSVMVSQAGAAEMAKPKAGLWERFCLEQNILDACGKATRSLELKIRTTTQADVLAQLQSKLNEVTQKRCRLQEQKACLPLSLEGKTSLRGGRV